MKSQKNSQTWNAKIVRMKTIAVVMPAAMMTASVSYSMLTWIERDEEQAKETQSTYHAQGHTLC